MKRLFDVISAGVGITILAPFLAWIAWRIYKENGLPIFYRGLRVGINGKPFLIYKFRTMIINSESLGGTSTPEDDPRLTRFGRFLRQYKIDELPQLLNVLRGEMSFVGPRPQVLWAVARYSKDEQLLLSVRPGISDYASIRFKDEAKILKGSANPDLAYLEKIAPEKIRLGLQYIKNRSPWLDFKIILGTFLCLFRKEEIDAKGRS